MTVSQPQPDPSAPASAPVDPGPQLVHGPDLTDGPQDADVPKVASRTVLAWCIWATFVVGFIVAVIAFTLAGSLWEREERAAVAGVVTAAVALLTLVPGPPPGVAGIVLAWLGDRIRGGPALGSRQVTRRDLLIITAGTAVTGPIAAKIVGPPPPPLRIAGWDELFLTADRTAQPWWRGIKISPALKELSGMQLLAPTTDLSAFDAVTCPSTYIVERLEERIAGLPGVSSYAPRAIGTERMVVLGRADRLKALIAAEIVVCSDKDEVWFDLARYINRCTWSWRSQDPDLGVDDPITLFASNPRTASGGQNFLLAIATAYANDPSTKDPKDLSPLWSARGPFASEMPMHSRDLWERLKHFGLIYTYEHHALSTLSTSPGEFVMMCTRPEVTVTQYLMALTEPGLELTRRLGRPAARQQLERSLRLPPSFGGGEATTAGATPAELTLKAITSAGHPLPLKVDWGTKAIRPPASAIERIYAQYPPR